MGTRQVSTTTKSTSYMLKICRKPVFLLTNLMVRSIELTTQLKSMHCNTEQGRTGNKQGYLASVTVFPCNREYLVRIAGQLCVHHRISLLVSCSTLFGVAVWFSKITWYPNESSFALWNAYSLSHNQTIQILITLQTVCTCNVHVLVR